MTKKIFQSILLVASLVLVASAVIIMGCLYDYFGGVQRTLMKDELSLAAVAVEEDGTAYLSNVDSDRYRLTWIGEDGKVLYDTKVDAETMENHAEREEIVQARENGQGESTRYSATFLEKTVYEARLLDDGSFLRISMSHATVGTVLLGMLQPILIVVVVALVLSAVLASRLSKRIVGPLNELDLEHPLENDAYEELAPLLGRISRQSREISTQLRTLKQRTDEFAQITGSMKEGLALLDDRGRILSINAAAQALFGVDGSCVGQDFLTVDRDHDMSAAIADARTAGHSEVRTERGGRSYQFDITRIDFEGEMKGTVLLAFDITEQEHAERNRREFTANVSHELKTPLQGIIGSAELIEKGMVHQEDLPRFVGHIHAEAARLVGLIDDIIRLSQLDEGDAMPRGPVDLLRVAEEVVTNLQETARSKQIELTLDGQPAHLSGVQRLIYEIVYNLTENAIKYGREDGHVRVGVAALPGGGAELTVADDGIGIAPEDQGRVFERFYRVDKSHSKASGGTGLGLSIVKHAVQYHHGKLDLKSALGKGTTITVTFLGEKN